MKRKLFARSLKLVGEIGEIGDWENPNDQVNDVGLGDIDVSFKGIGEEGVILAIEYYDSDQGTVGDQLIIDCNNVEVKALRHYYSEDRGVDELDVKQLLNKWEDKVRVY